MNKGFGDFVREYIYPLLLVITVGACAWYVTTKEEAVRTETKIANIEAKIEVLTEVVDILKDIKVEFAKISVWREGVDTSIGRLKEGTSSQYTQLDAKKDLQHFTDRINFLEQRILDLEIKRRAEN